MIGATTARRREAPVLTDHVMLFITLFVVAGAFVMGRAFERKRLKDAWEQVENEWDSIRAEWRMLQERHK